MIKRIFVGLMLAVLMFAGVACSPSVTTQETVTKLQVGAGPFEDPKFKDCIEPGVKRNTPTNDKYFAYPISDRDYDATGQDGSDVSPFTVVSKDNVEMAVPLVIRFNMITDCDTLKAFHKAHGARYNASLNEDGTSTEGWLTMLRKLMGDPVDTELDEIAKKYNWLDLYNDPEAQNEMQAALSENIDTIVAKQARGEFFDNYNVLVKKPKPTDGDLLATITKAQTDFAAAEAKVRQAEADQAQAEAEVQVARAQAEKRRAEISGFGGFENYNKARAVEQGLNPYQPTYKVSGTN